MKWKYIWILSFVTLTLSLKAQDSLMYEQEVDTTEYSDDSLESVPYLPVDTFVKRNFDSSFKHKYKGDAFDYTEKNPKPKTREDNSFPIEGLLDAFVYFLYIVIGIGIIIGVYILVSVLLGKEGAWLINRKSDDKSVFYGDELEQSADTDFKSLINKALESNDFRLAIRYQYLLLLQKMAHKNIIELHKDKTNSDYQYEIKNATLRQSFGYLSYIYDYAWYGEFEVSRPDYEQAEKAFDETLQMI
jgi:Domain of unknown function (DUF4129)